MSSRRGKKEIICVRKYGSRQGVISRKSWSGAGLGSLSLGWLGRCTQELEQQGKGEEGPGTGLWLWVWAVCWAQSPQAPSLLLGKGNTDPIWGLHLKVSSYPTSSIPFPIPPSTNTSIPLPDPPTVHLNHLHPMAHSSHPTNPPPAPQPVFPTRPGPHITHIGATTCPIPPFTDPGRGAPGR